jgi:ABC-2 type transport system ATP-binding protein
MRVLTGYTPPTSGLARVGGFDVSRNSVEARRLIGYLPESAPVYGEMTTRGYVEFFAEAKGLRGAARKKAVERALEECGLSHVAERLLMNLSKGYRQRAGLAQAVVGDPKILILDEPTVGLDPAQIREVRSLIRGMAGRRTVVLSTHILPEVSLTCSRVVIINKGRVVASGTPEDIHARARVANNLLMTIRGPKNQVEDLLRRPAQVVRVVCSEAPAQGASATEARIFSGSDSSSTAPSWPVHEYRIEVGKRHDMRAEFSRAVVQAGFDLLETRSMGLSLEDVFIQTIAGDVSDEDAAESGDSTVRKGAPA